MHTPMRRMAFSSFLAAVCALPSLAAATPVHTVPPAVVAAPAAAAAPVVALPHFSNIVYEGSLADGAGLYSQKDSSTLVSGIELFLLAGVDRQGQNQGGVAALTAEMLLDAPVQEQGKMVPLQDAIRLRGGLLVAEIEGQNVHFYLEARNEQLADLAALCAKAFAAPMFDRSTFAVALHALRVRVLASRDNPLTAVTLMFRDAFYSTTNAGAPPLGTLADLDRVTRSDAAAFYHRAYRLGGASATVIGDTSDANKAAAKALLLSLAPGSSQPAHITARPPLAPQTSIISFRNVSAPWVLLGFPAPSADSEDFGAMLVLSTMIEDAFTRESTTTVPIAERPVGLEYDFHSSPATVVLYVDGAAIDESMALRELGILRLALGSSALTEQYVDRYKNMAAGSYINNVATLAQRAQEIASLAHLGLGPDGLNTVLQRISAVKPVDIQRVLKKYFDESTASLVLPHDEENR